MLLSIFLLWGLIVHAQKKAKIGKSYIVKTDIRVFQYNFLDNCLQEKAKIAPKNSIFEIIDEDTAWLIIKFWSRNDTLRSLEHIDYTDAGLYFALNKSAFLEKCMPYNPKVLTFGAVVVPIKLRLGGKNDKQFDFSKDISIGNAIGIRRMLNENKGYSINYLASIGINICNT